MIKLQSQFEDLKKALSRLREAVILPADQTINQDATIQRFEFTFELSWKIMQGIVNENIKNVYGPKQVIREAAKLGLINDPEKWFLFLHQRNMSVHTYREEVAKEVYASAKEFIVFVDALISLLEKHISGSRLPPGII